MPDAQEPITLEEAKAHLRVDGADEDDLIQALIVAAREIVEDETGLVLTPRTVKEGVRCIGHAIDIETWPIAEPTDISISYRDQAGQLQPLPMSGWYANMDRRPIRIMPIHSWGGVDCIGRGATLTIDAGWEPEDVPATIKTAMKLLLSHFYHNPHAVIADKSVTPIEVPVGVQYLLRRWKLVRV